MIVFGGGQFIPFLLEDESLPTKKWYKLNYYNPIMLGTSINMAYPPQQLCEQKFLNNIDDQMFDFEFANYLLSENNAFISFMNIVMSHYYHGDTFVLYDSDNQWIQNLVEVIIELIYQRYGATCSIVNDMNDLWWLSDDFRMSDNGHRTFMADKERFTLLTATPLTTEQLETLEVNNAFV